jgi:hypothetical protein
MADSSRSPSTPCTDAAFDLLARIAVDPDNDERYPDGTVLIPADSPDAALLLSRSLAKRRPTVLVLPDGAVSIPASRSECLPPREDW